MLKHKKESGSHFCMAIGIAVGILVGAAVHNVPVVTGILMCVGIVLDYVISKKQETNEK